MVVNTIEKGVIKRFRKIQKHLHRISSIAEKRLSVLQVDPWKETGDVHDILHTKAQELTSLKNEYLKTLAEEDAALQKQQKLIGYLKEVIKLEEHLYGKLLREEIGLIKKVHEEDTEIKQKITSVLEEVTSILAGLNDGKHETAKNSLEVFWKKCNALMECELAFDHALDKATLAQSASLWKTQRETVTQLSLALESKQEKRIRTIIDDLILFLEKEEWPFKDNVNHYEEKKQEMMAMETQIERSLDAVLKDPVFSTQKKASPSAARQFFQDVYRVFGAAVGGHPLRPVTPALALSALLATAPPAVRESGATTLYARSSRIWDMMDNNAVNNYRPDVNYYKEISNLIHEYDLYRYDKVGKNLSHLIATMIIGKKYGIHQWKNFDQLIEEDIIENDRLEDTLSVHGIPSKNIPGRLAYYKVKKRMYDALNLGIEDRRGYAKILKKIEEYGGSPDDEEKETAGSRETPKKDADSEE